MITITNADLMDQSTLFGLVISTLQAELEVSVYTGTGTIIVDWGNRVRGLGAGEPPPPQSLDPIDVGPFRVLVNDVHLSQITAEWTSRHGGALLLRTIFEEEGTEIRGGVDFNLKHLELDVFLIPSIDAGSNVVWEIELVLEFDGPALLEAYRKTVEEELLNGTFISLLTDSLELVTGQLNRLLGLADLAGVNSPFGSITIDNTRAVFVDPAPGSKRFQVIFDFVEIHDDSDWPGQGELSFRSIVNGFPSEFSEEADAASGMVVPLAGAMWRTTLNLLDTQSIKITFEARDRETIGGFQSLGVVDFERDAPSFKSSETFALPSSKGNFTINFRVLMDEAASEGSRHLRVTFPSVKVLRDQEMFGKGEVQFYGVVNGQPTATSTETKAAGGEDPTVVPRDINGDLLQTELFLPSGQQLAVRFVGWDVDPSQRDSLGEALLTKPFDAEFDQSDIEVEAESRNFVVTIRIEDLDVVEPETPGSGGGGGGQAEPAETVSRLVVFESVLIKSDGDFFGAGEILASAVVNGRHLGAGETIDTSSGATLPLFGSHWRTEVKVPIDSTLDITASVTDVDRKTDDLKHDNDDDLGTALASFGADADFGLGNHVISDSNGNFSFNLRVLDPAISGEVTAMVRLEEAIIRHDHAALARGSFWCTASINGWPLDDSEKYKAGRGDSIVLDSIAWQRQVWLDDGEALNVRFEVFEAKDNDHKSLGVVNSNFSLPWPTEVQVLNADSEDFELHCRIWVPSEEKNNQLLVTFKEVTVIDDGDVSSEGEIYFLGGANQERTGMSSLIKVKKGETVSLVGSQWILKPGLNRGESLSVSFTTYDEDQYAYEVLDRFEDTFSMGEAWGLGEHLATSPNGSFRVRFLIEPATPESVPDLPGMHKITVAFSSVEILDDADSTSNGEITLTGSVNGVTVLKSPEYKVSSGDTIFLGEPLNSRTIWLREDQDLTVKISGTERDNNKNESLGVSEESYSALDGWSVGNHRVKAGSEKFFANWSVIEESRSHVVVKFIKVHVFNDRDWFSRGDVVCEGIVNGVSTGPSVKMKAGSDGPSSNDDIRSDIFLGGPRWKKTIFYDPENPSIDLTFTVTDDDTISKNLLGTAIDSFGSDLGAGNIGIGIHTITADSGRFELTYLIQKVVEA